MSTNPKKNEDVAWNPDTSAFGARLALVRWKMGWNVAEAERECGTTQNLWANWESGSMPRQLVEVATKIAWKAKVERDWLLTGDETPRQTPAPGELPGKLRTGNSHRGNVRHVDFTRKIAA
jgi:hypothetical protein